MTHYHVVLSDTKEAFLSLLAKERNEAVEDLLMYAIEEAILDSAKKHSSVKNLMFTHEPITVWKDKL